MKQQIEIHVERGRSIDLAILYAKRRKSIFDWISSKINNNIKSFKRPTWMAEWENWDQNLLHWERVYLLNGMAESFREEGGIIGVGA